MAKNRSKASETVEPAPVVVPVVQDKPVAFATCSQCKHWTKTQDGYGECRLTPPFVSFKVSASGPVYKYIVTEASLPKCSAGEMRS